MRDEKFVSPSGHELSYLTYKHQWNTIFHLLKKGTIYYATIAMVISLHVTLICEDDMF